MLISPVAIEKRVLRFMFLVEVWPDAPPTPYSLSKKGEWEECKRGISLFLAHTYTSGAQVDLSLIRLNVLQPCTKFSYHKVSQRIANVILSGAC